MSLGGNVTVSLGLTETATPDIGSVSASIAPSWTRTFTNGSGIDQATKVFVDSVTLAGSATQDYDLDSGALVGVMGQVIAAFSRIAGILIRRTDTPVASTQDENVKLHGDFILSKLLGGWVDDAVWIPLRPGAVFVYISPDATGTAVTASTGDVITLTNISAADSCTVETVIFGS